MVIFEIHLQSIVFMHELMVSRSSSALSSLYAPKWIGLSRLPAVLDLNLDHFPPA